MRWSTGMAGVGRAVAVCLTSLGLVVGAGCDGHLGSGDVSTRGSAAHGHGHSHAHGHDHAHGRSDGAGAPSVEGTPAPSRHAPAGSTVIEPGLPGQPARTLAPDVTLPVDQHNGADVAFLRRMIPHHAQALEMGRLARSRAGHPEVRAMAARIHDAQGPEIVGMSGWLERHGERAPAAAHLRHHVGHMSMPGMLTEARMRRLRAARGHPFDVLFLRSMTRHHRGAIRMAHHVAEHGRNIVVGELAADIAATQSAEIQRMQRLLRSIT